MVGILGDTRCQSARPDSVRPAIGMSFSRLLGTGVQRVRASLALGALAGLSIAGCGSSTPTLNTAPIAHAIGQSILAQRNITTTVHCPATVPRRAGVEFSCTARLEVGSYPVSVRETNANGRVRYGNAAPLVVLNIKKVERAIAGSILSQRHLRAVVTCPAEVIQQAGVTFTCAATANGARYPFAVTETNGHGQVRYEGEPRVAGQG
jgi:hypothetical protein